MLNQSVDERLLGRLERAGVDLTQRATVQAVIEQMDRLVSQMETEAAKIR